MVRPLGRLAAAASAGASASVSTMTTTPRTARYTNPDPDRGQYRPDKPTFVGLQSYSDYSATTAFRDIRITALEPG